MAEAKAEAQESSSPRCLLLLARGLQAACQAVSAERFCLLALASCLPTEHVLGLVLLMFVVFINCCLGFLCCLFVIIFGFASSSQLIGGSDRL